MPAEGRGGLPIFVPAQDRIVSVNLIARALARWSLCRKLRPSESPSELIDCSDSCRN